MNRVFLIARQEFVKFVTRRGFLFTLIGVPIWMALATIVPAMLGNHSGQTMFAVVDRSGGAYRDAIAQSLARRDARIGSHDLALIDTPSDVAGATPDAFANAARPYLDGKKKVKNGDANLEAIVVIPRNFDVAPAAFWSEHKDSELRDFVQSALDRALRLRAAKGFHDPAAVAALDAEAPISSVDPTPTGKSGLTSTAVSVGLPVGTAILLLIVSLMNSMALLQGVIEEKSTRMVEVLLSCATPWEIVGGKIAGVIAVALFTVLIWVTFALLAASVFLGAAAGALFSALGSALASPVILPLIIIYFMCGLLIYGAVFLSIGSMSASLADAQAYLGPSMMILMLPNLFITPILNSPNGTIATVASYFPIYTPYIMLLRVGSHPPLIEIVTTVLLAVGLTIFLVWKAGDIFARHALTTERPPAVRSMFARLLGRSPAVAEK
jgi:ABC-2 type transport system permease protein